MEMIRKVRQLPLFLLAREEILRFVQENGIESGELIPPETALCEKLGISRGTLREAMRVLEEEGFIVRKQGVGTFVSHPEQVISSTLDLNESVSEMIRGKGMVPGSIHGHVETMIADERLREILDLRPGDSVIAVKRIRTANGLPVAYTEDFVPAKVVSEDVMRQLGDGSLYDLIEDSLGMELASSLVKLRPMKASKELAEPLGVKAGDLLMLLQQTDTSLEKRPILYSEEYFVPQRFEFVVVRKRRKRIRES
jgi:GntR family transcriptional regulator